MGIVFFLHLLHEFFICSLDNDVLKVCHFTLFLPPSSLLHLASSTHHKKENVPNTAYLIYEVYLLTFDWDGYFNPTLENYPSKDLNSNCQHDMSSSNLM